MAVLQTDKKKAPQGKENFQTSKLELEVLN